MQSPSEWPTTVSPKIESVPETKVFNVAIMEPEPDLLHRFQSTSPQYHCGLAIMVQKWMSKGAES